MRCASPSTMAVLPTPGSPIKTGLFLVRRLKNLHDPADLGIAADHRVHLAVPRQLDQVAAVALERLVLVLGVLIGDALAAANLLKRLQDLLLADAQRFEQGLAPGS